MEQNKYIVHAKNSFWEQIELTTDEKTLEKFLNSKKELYPSEFYDTFDNIEGAEIINDSESFIPKEGNIATLEIYVNEVSSSNLYWDNKNGFAKNLTTDEYKKINTILEVLDSYEEQMYELFDPYADTNELLDSALLYNFEAIIGLSLENNDEIMVHLVEFGDLDVANENKVNIKNLPKSVINDIYKLVCTFENINTNQDSKSLYYYVANSSSGYFGSVIVTAYDKISADEILEKWTNDRYDDLMESDFDLKFSVKIDDENNDQDNIVISNIIFQDYRD